MSQQGAPPQRWTGYEEIARATGKRLGRSVSVRTAKRWAMQGRALRLPVCIYPDGRAYMLAADLEVFATAWLAVRPSGGRLPGKPRNRAA